MKFFDEKVTIMGPKKSKFDLSHERKFSCNMGELIPILVQDVMPGDSFKVSSEQMMRLAPMIAPMMHRVNVYMHYFFVPNRLLWDEWEDFITGGQVGSTPPVFPTFNIGGAPTNKPELYKAGSLMDYLGVPPIDTYTTGPSGPVTSPLTISALPFRAYRLIYDQYFRDEDISAQIDPPDKSSGPVSQGLQETYMEILHRSWEKDYYTSARPWAQKGGSVGIPFTYKDISEVKDENGNPAAVNTLVGTHGSLAGEMMVGKTDAVTGGTFGRVENIEALASINELREASALQRFLEKLARSGNRYIEYIKSIFGETSSDSRLQRPEYLGGGRSPIVISEVLSTFDNTTGGLPQGTMSGHGISAGTTNGFSRSFNEHGYIMCLMSVLPRTGYQQGIEKHFTRFEQLDFPIPDFAHLGEQEVKGKELYVNYAEADPATKELTFGYQSRYSECKFKNNTSHGDFRNTLAFWHMDRIFGSRPVLNEQFIKADPTFRVFAVTDEDQDHLWCNVHHSISAVRPLPYHGNGSLS
ncbi:MAG: major capsid protein [Microviridae sp.]|nr:MAG: major capsid protein [Microviridae sp.]